METAAARQRTEGYRPALAAAGVAHDPDLEIPVRHWTTEQAVDATPAHLAQHAAPDAFVCFTDSMALGVLSVLWERGLRVPDDVAVAGFDDVAAARYAVPPLTTVAFDLRGYAVAALDLLSERIADPGRPLRQLVYPHRVVVRRQHRLTSPLVRAGVTRVSASVLPARSNDVMMRTGHGDDAGPGYRRRRRTRLTKE